MKKFELETTDMGTVTIIRETEPFEVDGITYYPPAWVHLDYVLGNSMFKLKKQDGFMFFQEID